MVAAWALEWCCRYQQRPVVLVLDDRRGLRRVRAAVRGTEVGVRVVFEGRMHVSYSQAYISSGDSYSTYDGAFDGQVNGLLGAGLPGALTMMTGVHTGSVGLRVMLAEQAPPLGQEWEDVVEVSYHPDDSDVSIAGCLSDTVCTFELAQTSYRVRLSARGMDAGRAADVVMEDEPLLDSYELAFWPADPAPDAIVRQGSEIAAYRNLTQDPEKARAMHVQAVWGDDPPSERLIDVWGAPWLVEHDRDLTEALAAAEPGVQRAVAYWAAQRACREAGVDQLDWIAAGLAALHRDEQLPAPFDEPAAMYARLDADERAPRRTVTAHGQSGSEQGAQALFTVLHATWGNVLDAAVSTLAAAHGVFGDDRVDVLVREAGEALRALQVDSIARHGQDPVPDTRVPAQELEEAEEVVPDGYDPEHYWMFRSLWEGELPSPRLFEVHAWLLGNADRDLAEAIAAADPGMQRDVARWAARRACEDIGLTVLPQVGAALDAADRGDALPAPFDREGGEWSLIEDDPRVSDHLIVVDGSPNCSGWHFTLPVIRQAVDGDPLRAAVEALWTAAFAAGDDARVGVLAAAAAHFFPGLQR